MAERGRNLDNILRQYETFVKPCYEEFCLPTKKYADVIIPRGADNVVAIDLIVNHIQEILRSPRSTPTMNGTNGDTTKISNAHKPKTLPIRVTNGSNAPLCENGANTTPNTCDDENEGDNLLPPMRRVHKKMSVNSNSSPGTPH